MATAITMTREQIAQLIFSKEDAMRNLCYHRNNSLAVEMYREYQADIAQLRRILNN